MRKVLPNQTVRRAGRDCTRWRGTLLLLLTLLAASCSSGLTQASANQLSLGKRVYDQQCASCHGMRGEGQYPAAPYKPDKDRLIGAPPHDSTGHTWHHPDAALIDIIRNGLIVEGFHPMPAFGDKLSNEEIQAVLAYIKTWWKPDQIERQATASAKYTPPAPN